MAPEALSCRFLSASTTSGRLPALVSLAPWRAPLEDRGGVVDLCRGPSVFFLRRLFPFFPIFPLFPVPAGICPLHLSGPSPPSIFLEITFWYASGKPFGNPLGWTLLLLFLDTWYCFQFPSVKETRMALFYWRNLFSLLLHVEQHGTCMCMY